jgi:hypothetical protein
MDGGSARDLRAAAGSAGPTRQLTGLFATAHRPDARTRPPVRIYMEYGFPEYSARTHPTPMWAPTFAVPREPQRAVRRTRVRGSVAPDAATWRR